jgi:hypothetical protein
MKYIEKATLADAQATADDLWDSYYAREIAARGLKEGDSLDISAATGEMVPAVTVRYAAPIAVDGTLALVPVDDDAAKLTAEPVKTEETLTLKARTFLTAQKTAAEGTVEEVEQEA